MPSAAPQPEQLFFCSDGRTPNSPHPVLLYRGLPLAGGDYASAFERLFASHLWPAQWRAACMTISTTIQRRTKCWASRAAVLG